MEPNRTDVHHSASARMSSRAVQLVREYTGRGPTKTRTTINADVAATILGDSLTKGERKLVENGNRDIVLDVRRRFQQVMREDLTALVQDTTGRKVIAFMSDQHLDPDLAAETFVLEPQTQVEDAD
jgi:uncharacterized protein YbcI